jgi:aminoacrylate hydrolase
MSAVAEPRDGTTVGGLHVRRFGDPRHPAVLFSAGLGGSGSYWSPQVAALAAEHHVLLYDHRGTGLSDRTPLPLPYSVAHLADDMAIVLDGLGIARAHVVGHAAGGVAALELALAAPDRVASVTVVNGWALAGPHFLRCLEIRRAIHAAGGADAYLKAQPPFLYPAAWIDRNLDRLDRERALHAAHFQSAATLDARIAALGAFDGRDRLPTVTTPTLLVVSADDQLVPPTATAELAAALPHATVARMAWGGHAANVTDPAAFDAILGGFLRALPHT